MDKKKVDTFGDKLYKTWDEFEDATFKRMDKKWDLPQPTEAEDQLIFKMARDHLWDIVEKGEYDTCKCCRAKDIKTLNEKYQLLFKLNMLAYDEKDDEVKEGMGDPDDKTSYKV